MRGCHCEFRNRRFSVRGDKLRSRSSRLPGPRRTAMFSQKIESHQTPRHRNRVVHLLIWNYVSNNETKVETVHSADLEEVAPELLIAARGVVYPWQCDHMGHMIVMWYTGKFDEPTWHLLSQNWNHTVLHARKQSGHSGRTSGNHLQT